MARIFPIGSYVIPVNQDHYWGDESRAVFRIYAVSDDKSGIFDGQQTVYAHNAAFYADSQFGRVTLLEDGWIGPFCSEDRARAALSQKDA